VALCYKSLGQYEKAIAYHQQHHDISEEIGNRQGVASSLGNLGICYRNLGQYEKAIALFLTRNLKCDRHFQFHSHKMRSPLYFLWESRADGRVEAFCSAKSLEWD
jgi:tetratricopeptide (TPR) repeat protein